MPFWSRPPNRCDRGRRRRFGGRDQKGIQIIGNYGTGKSHLMSLIQLVAEFPEYLDDIQNDKARDILAPIAGKFKVHRFEIGTAKHLWPVVTYQLQNFLNANGVDYHFDPNSLKNYGEQLEEMMATFEDKFPDHGFMFVIDEMLSYLKGQVAIGQLEQDLAVLQALGQACAKGRFCFMFGVQEMIYHSNEFQYARDMLQKVKDRFRDLTIRREDVAYVVQKRLLSKSEQQKALIRQHLEPFTPYFSDMHANIEQYVNLFPVHPSYFDNFQKIKLGQSQREVLKTLSRQFEQIKDKEIPNDNPGLITYDQYWEQLMCDPSQMSDPDFKRVADTVKIVHDKIQNNFDGAKKRQIPLAKRIADACAIKILQGELSKRGGATANTLVDDLCCTFPVMDDREFLIDQVANCANYIIRATSGQYFEKDDDSGEYRLRTEGGVNIDEQIREYAELNMPSIIRDRAFYKFIVEIMQIDSNPYRTGFEIYKHEITWTSHRITRDGYIFLGGPNEKSTTHPKQHFYMIFMPIFQQDKKKRNQDPDEVYFVMDGLSQQFKDYVCLYGAAFTLYNSATSDRKPLYREKMEELFRKARQAFDECYLQETIVYHAEEEGRTLQSFSIPGGSKQEVFNTVASRVLDEHFSAAAPHYPSFTNARQVITNDNLERFIKSALNKIARPQDSLNDGETVLAGLGLWHNGALGVDESIYAESIMRKIEEREPQQVINRDELLHVAASDPDRGVYIYRSIDYDIEAYFEFLVIATMVTLGECEVKMANGTIINASNINVITQLPVDELQNFSFVKRPQGANLPLIREITLKLCNEDLSAQLDREGTYAKLVNAAKDLAHKTATFIGTTLAAGPIVIGNVSILSEESIASLRNHLVALKGFADKLSTYTSEAKIKNLQWPMNDVKTLFDYKKDMDNTRYRVALSKRLQGEVAYLSQAKEYVPADTELAHALDASIGALPNILTNHSEQQVREYEEELQQVKQKYIAWYLTRYRAFCLSDIDMRLRTQILNSPQYIVCQVLSSLTAINTSLWPAWMSMFSKLKPADSDVEVKLQTAPSCNFNPLIDATTPKTVQQLRDDLNDIYDTWIAALKDYLNTSETQAQLQLMNQADRDFARSFLADMTQLTDAHSARAMVEFIATLSRGLDPVEIDHNAIMHHFNRAMTVDEAQATFDRLLMLLIRGKKREKVRIVFK